MNTLHNFYLKARTSVGIIHLPLVKQTPKDGGIELVFTWVVFEKDVRLYSYQPMAEVGRPASEHGPKCQVMEDYVVGRNIKLNPDEQMYLMPAGEVGCFVFTVPYAAIRDLDPNYNTTLTV